LLEIDCGHADDLLGLFRESFPDFRCTTPVYFLFAAGALDGATRQVGGRSALLFGLDLVARSTVIS
jgi:hypothetical protein